MVRIAIIIMLGTGMISCGVKKAPSPLYSIPVTALKTTPTPASTPSPSPSPSKNKK